MVILYHCILCGTNPDQLSHHKAHLATEKHKEKKQNKMNQENLDEEAIKNLETFTNEEIKSCSINGKGMSQWHKEQQSRFSKEKTEVNYDKTSDKQHKNRRADVVPNEANVLECQHSPITREEVNERNEDYKLHGKTAIWVIDGNKQNIKIEFDNISKVVILDFSHSKKWLYRSFKDCDYIYIHIDKKIYKICPRDIPGEVGKVQEVYENVFYESLIKGYDGFPKGDDTKVHLYLTQMGAGNGKTWQIVQLLNDEHFDHIDYFIYWTKQHSQKHIIREEFLKQATQGQLQINSDYEINDSASKHPKITVTRSNGKQAVIIFETIDSAMFSLSSDTAKEKNGFDIFGDLAVDVGKDSNSVLKCGNTNVKLNSKVLFIIDETQLISSIYSSAIIKIMLKYNCNFYLVGDKLQSTNCNILNDTNNMNLFCWFFANQKLAHQIRIIENEPVNICRRFQNKQDRNFVNYMVPFSDYNLPEVRLFKKYDGEHPHFIINPFYKTDKQVVQIMEIYKKEVKNGYSAQDFLIISPYVNNNAVVVNLNEAINKYWGDKNDSIAKKYCHLHQSEENGSINLAESNDTTRIVSIQTSQGDGRPVVIVLGLEEAKLKRFSKETNNLIYDSLLHVAITRMADVEDKKAKLYIFYRNNGDDICRKIDKYIQHNNCKPENRLEKISKIIRNNDIPDSSSYMTILYEKLMKNEELKAKFTFKNYKTHIDTDHDLVDFGFHKNRYNIFYILSILYIRYGFCQYDQVNITIQNIIHAKIELCDTYEQYNLYLEILSCYDKDKEEKKKKVVKLIQTYDKPRKELFNDIIEDGKIFIPILNYNNKKWKEKFVKGIEDDIRDIQAFLNTDKVDPRNLTKRQCIIFSYLFETVATGIYKNFSCFDLYDLLVRIENGDTKIEAHYNKIKNTLWDTFRETNGHDFRFTISMASAKYSGGSDDFSLEYRLPVLIGMREKTNETFIFCFQPTLGSINFTSTIMKCLLDNYFIDNAIERGQVIQRLKGSKITTCIYSFDFTEPIYLKWENEQLKFYYDDIRQFLTSIIFDRYKTENKAVWIWYKNLRDEKIDITQIKQRYNDSKDKKNGPPYIDEFIRNEIRQININKYDNKNIFMEGINSYLEKAVERFFDI